MNSIKEGTVNDFVNNLKTECSYNTKFIFIKAMVEFGALKPNGTIHWGERDLVRYKKDRSKVYDIFVNTKQGYHIRSMFSKEAMFIDTFFGLGAPKKPK